MIIVKGNGKNVDAMNLVSERINELERDGLLDEGNGYAIIASRNEIKEGKIQLPELHEPLTEDFIYRRSESEIVYDNGVDEFLILTNNEFGIFVFLY